MYALAEEYARRTVQLRHHNALGTVDNKRAILRHIRNGAQEYILYERTEVLVVRVSTIQFHLGLQRYTIGQSALETLVNGVAWRIDKVIQELKNEIITCVGDREVL